MPDIRLGIDEAGKGPVIGPMCIAGVCATEEQEIKLKNLGVADSKKLTAKKREQLAVSIKKYVTSWYVYEVEAKQIDDLRKIMTMNEIMVLCFSKVMEELSIPEDEAFNVVFLDAADVSEERFARRVHDEYAKKYEARADQIEYVSKHKADTLSPVVSAASILAKTRRDELIEEIKKKEKVDFGSGYPSDPKTKQFLENYAKEHGDFPDYVRKSWKTAENLL
ncbi:Ribonuclease HII [Methanimicrococcus stummii]|uniref:Ribonuclease HII n=1 Tax=Methanimicrococcus stummii TaxID=3028294 RepID=A0AA96VMJ7_9EURY|nr:ribonuclease HII [Methanimicrococcus sp. Es2]WNY28892.1 Ribonuclease HII [Methanimicrococcus sp. Es2]